ncbi:MAG: GNAT family N-acetyltransferase [Acidimicrobiia bacterium]|nr:GNAT family N-acetyltransferase [Acidimicrobiia bacterium]
MEIRTDRLILRRWRESDREPFAVMNADPEVMRHMVAPLSRDKSDAFIERIEEGFKIWGFGLWAVELKGVGDFVGFTGLWPTSFDAHFTPAIEIGWRLDRGSWGEGYATEAARGALGFGFEGAGLEEVVSFTIPANVRSIAVMERLGMTHDPADDFDHPSIPAGSPLRRHVLYRMTAERWRAPEKAGDPERRGRGAGPLP